MNSMHANEFDITRLLNPDAYDHPVKNIELIETHISWVLLTGDFVYKIKKPVDFGFLDFSTLEKRRLCCEQEVSLNRRLAPDMYLDVVSIVSANNGLTVSGEGEVLEYAVKMLQFSQSYQLDNMLVAGELSTGQMDVIARMVANFHQCVQVSDDTSDYGNKDKVYQPVEENFIQINEHLSMNRYADALNELQSFTKAEYVKLEAVFDKRKRDGFIRECHGDMHLRNMVWLDNGPTAFDCIEFNANLRWIDVISEIAFLIMDLHARKSYQLANRFLNTYLEITGDYEGLTVLSFYLSYRALVRAKVAALRFEQKNTHENSSEKSLLEFESYLELAKRYTHNIQPSLIIMRGLSASGKSTVARQVVDEIGAIRIRSDVERKRLFNISLAKNAGEEIDTGIYSTQASQQTYEKLADLASMILSAGYSAVVDAAFLKYEQREYFKVLASRLGVPFKIVEVTASHDVLRKRISERKNDVSDADLAVLENQLLSWEPLKADEISTCITVNTESVVKLDMLVKGLATNTA